MTTKATMEEYLTVYWAMCFYGLFANKDFTHCDPIYNVLLNRVCSDEFEHLA